MKGFDVSISQGGWLFKHHFMANHPHVLDTISQAFVAVPHKRKLCKDAHFGVDGVPHFWLNARSTLSRIGKCTHSLCCRATILDGHDSQVKQDYPSQVQSI